jgi:hypothetical protein
VGCVTIAASIRAQARGRLRDAVLDEAYSATLAQGWGAVRMGDVAAAVGVSRQSVHNEFGTKEGLGQALVLRESAGFLASVQDVLDQHAQDPMTAIQAASAWALEALPQHPLLRAALTGQHDSLLPQFTSRSGPLLDRAADTVSQWVLQHYQDADPERVGFLADAVVRLVISYSVTPNGSPGATGERLANLFGAGMGWLDQSPAAARHGA